jgi:hypothetical protein
MSEWLPLTSGQGMVQEKSEAVASGEADRENRQKSRQQLFTVCELRSLCWNWVPSVVVWKPVWGA